MRLVSKLLVMALIFLNLPMAKAADPSGAPLSAKAILKTCYGITKSQAFTEECLARITTRDAFEDFTLIQDSCKGILISGDPGDPDITKGQFTRVSPNKLHSDCLKEGLNFVIKYNPANKPSNLTFRAGL